MASWDLLGENGDTDSEWAVSGAWSVEVDYICEKC
jgi:hypothetical protein